MTSTNQTSAEFQHFLGKARDALQGGESAWAAQSTGERAAVALVLNRAEWLQEMGYSIVDALDRAGPEWVEMMPSIAKALGHPR